MVRKKYKNLLIITPGIRFFDDSSNDQMRIMTPKQAFKNKVSGIVMEDLLQGNIKNIQKTCRSFKQMIKGCKICGIKDSDTLNYIINHPYPPKFIGFVVITQKLKIC